jgi:hypothetical protein
MLPPTLYDRSEQLTAILLTFADVIVPLPSATLHISPVGSVWTVTEYAVPEGSELASARADAPAGTLTAVALTISTSPEDVSPLIAALRL